MKTTQFVCQVVWACPVRSGGVCRICTSVFPLFRNNICIMIIDLRHWQNECHNLGSVAQMAERLLRMQEVKGSMPFSSTFFALFLHFL